MTSSCAWPRDAALGHPGAQARLDRLHLLDRALGAHGAAQLLGLAAGEARRHHGDLAGAAPGRAARPASARGSAPGWGGDRSTGWRPLPALEVGVRHAAGDRPRPDDRHLDHQVVELRAGCCAAASPSAPGSRPGRRRPCRPRGAFCRPPGRRAAGGRGRGSTPSRRADRGDRLLEGVRACRDPRRSTLMIPRSAQSSLSHCTTTRPGIEAGSSGTTSSSRPAAITMPPECWPRWRGRLWMRVQWSAKSRERGDLGVEAGGGDLGGEGPLVAARQVVGEAAELLGELVDLLRRIAEGLRHLAGRRAVAVGDDVGGHRRAVRAVALVDVLDHPLALVARGEVEVDVRPLAALLGEEALEEEVHLHRIDGGDREGVADGAVGRRAAPLGEDALAQAEAHDVPDDQEVAGELELLDQVELLLDLRLGLGGQRPEAALGAVPGDVAQVGGRRLARRQRVLGEAVAEVGEGEVEALGELGRGGDRLGEIREERAPCRRRSAGAARGGRRGGARRRRGGCGGGSPSARRGAACPSRGRSARRWWRRAGRRRRRARSTRATLRCSSSRRRWRCSSTWRRPGKVACRRSRSRRAASMRHPARGSRASGPSSPPVRQRSPPACAARRSQSTRASPFGRPRAAAVSSRQRLR